MPKIFYIYLQNIEKEYGNLSDFLYKSWKKNIAKDVLCSYYGVGIILQFTPINYAARSGKASLMESTNLSNSLKELLILILVFHYSSSIV